MDKVDLEKILKEIISLHSSMSREIERLNMKMFSLSKFLIDKGIMSDDEFDFYCSEKTIDLMAEIIDERLKEENL